MHQMLVNFQLNWNISFARDCQNTHNGIYWCCRFKCSVLYSKIFSRHRRMPFHLELCIFLIKRTHIHTHGFSLLCYGFFFLFVHTIYATKKRTKWKLCGRRERKREAKKRKKRVTISTKFIVQSHRLMCITEPITINYIITKIAQNISVANNLTGYETFCSI